MGPYAYCLSTPHEHALAYIGEHRPLRPAMALSWTCRRFHDAFPAILRRRESSYPDVAQCVEFRDLLRVTRDGGSSEKSIVDGWYERLSAVRRDGPAAATSGLVNLFDEIRKWTRGFPGRQEVCVAPNGPRKIFVQRA
jgi:hypothetical protein